MTGIVSGPARAPTAGGPALTIFPSLDVCSFARVSVGACAVSIKRMRLFEKRGDQVHAGLQVVLVHRFDHRVDVASRDRNGADRRATPGALDAAGIGAAARQNLQLVADVALAGQAARELYQFRIRNGRRVNNLDGGALSHASDLLVLAHTVRDHGERDVEGKPKCRADVERGRCGTAQTNFFLYSGDDIDVGAGTAHLAQRFEHDVNADAVVH